MSELALTRRSRLSVPAAATGALLLGALAAGTAFGAHIGALMVIGGLLGMVLYHAAFGFTAAWRVFITERRGRGLRAQMVMLAIAVLLFFPALGAGTLFGSENPPPCWRLPLSLPALAVMTVPCWVTCWKIV